METKTLLLAKYFSYIHSHDLVPFYTRNPDYDFWESLVQKTKKRNEVDKDLFIKMSEEILEQLSKEDKSKVSIKLAQHLSRIHSYDDLEFWSTLKEKTSIKDDVDRDFFIQIANMILEELEKVNSNN